MKVITTQKDGRLRFSLSGELDHHAARSIMEEIEDQIERHLPRECVLDMRDVTFMDSSGIAVLLKTYRRMNEIGGGARAENVPPQPMRVLDAAGIDRLVCIR